MDQRDRQQIQLNMGQLIQHTNYRVLMEECVRRRMLSEVMKAIIEVSEGVVHRTKPVDSVSR